MEKINDKGNAVDSRRARKEEACAHGSRAPAAPRFFGALAGEDALVHEPPALGLLGLDIGRDAQKSRSARSYVSARVSAVTPGCVPSGRAAWNGTKRSQK